MIGKIVILFAVIAIGSSFPEEVTMQWKKFKAQNNKLFSVVEEQERFAIFSDNINKIKQHNKLYDEGKVTYKMGITRFTDMNKDEFLNYLKLQGDNPVKNIGNTYTAPLGEELPASVDYRKQNAVNPIKDQGQCGSCWAFSTTGSLEINNLLKTGIELSLSEQDLVDCSSSYGNMGCGGGLMEESFDYIIDSGISEDKDYPYTAQNGNCNTNVPKSNITVTGHTAIVIGDEGDLQSAVANIGAISVAVDASDFQLYDSGILTEGYCCSDRYCLNHGVVLIGYDSENGQDYWIVRNSWGAAWGEDGYIRLARGKDNLCGIATCACYPIIA